MGILYPCVVKPYDPQPFRTCPGPQPAGSYRVTYANSARPLARRNNKKARFIPFIAWWENSAAKGGWLLIHRAGLFFRLLIVYHICLHFFLVCLHAPLFHQLVPRK